MLFMSLLALPFTHATSPSQPAPTSLASNSSFITMPIYCSYAEEYYLKVANGGHKAPVRIDYLQPELWVIEGQDLLECNVLYTLLGQETGSTFSTSVVYEHSTYNGYECYWMDAFYPTRTVTTTVGSSVTTMIETQQTGGSFYEEYANGIAASGVTATANLTFALEDSQTLALPSFNYALVTDSNRYIGCLGLASNPYQNGFLDTLASQNLTLSNSFSVFYFNQSDSDTMLAGYLFPGAVDKSLYTGDFYSFPLIPFVGWGTLDAALPIISVDSIDMENLETQNTAKIYDEGALPIAIDPLLDFNYLPLSAIVNIALQVNAFYSNSQGLWVVKCSNIKDSNAVLNLNIGPLSLQIPLTSILMDQESRSPLRFASGEAACVLNVFPSDVLGYPCIGSPWLRFMYMAMDSEGHNIGLANSNRDLNADSGLRNQTMSHITSGHIPFATSYSASSKVDTFTFYKQNYTSKGTIPARLSQVRVNSNGVYITGDYSYSGTSSASAAHASTTGGAGSGMAGMAGSASYLIYMVIFVGSVMGLGCL